MADSVPGDVSSTVAGGVGTTFLGTIETRGDHDWFRMTLTAGQGYSFATSFGGGAQTLDTFLILRDAAGAVLASDDDGGPTNYSLIGYTPTTSGTYFLDVGGFNDASTGTYRVAISSTAPPPGDLAAGDTNTTGAIAVGGSVTGTLEAIGDHDWYRVTLTGGQAYRFDTVATGGAGDPDTTVAIRDAAGRELAFNDDGPVGTYSQLRFTPATTGTYYVDVSSYGEAETGAFRLVASEAEALRVWSNDEIAYQLTHGYWGGTARRFDVATGGTITYNATGLTEAGANLAREAFALWTDATGIGFIPVATGGQITLDDNQEGAATSASRSGGTQLSATVNVSVEWLTRYGSGLNSYTFQAYVHEIGHALGLGHSGNYNGDAAFPTDALFLNDHWGASIMSYFSQTGNTYIKGLGFTAQYQQTPTAADDIAIANLYGNAGTTRTGDSRYGTGNDTARAVYDIAANPGGYVLVDAGGTDTWDLSGYAMAQVVNLIPESYSNIGGKIGNVSISRGTIIENATGGQGADRITGNDAANVLSGGPGADTLGGLTGNDTYLVDQAGDVVIETPGNGADTVFATASYTLPADAEVELLSTATNAGTSAAVLVGNGFSQAIVGDQGANTLGDGGLVAGPGDVLMGLAGDDVYIVNSKRTFVIENDNDGNDLVVVTALGSDFVLNAGTSVETLRAMVGGDAINVTGSPTSQRIEGNDGANILSTGSGAADTLAGGRGDDTYRVFGGIDTIVEAADAGFDRVFVSGNSFALNAGAAVEYISTSVQADTGNFYLVGNEVAQTIVGNYGDNILDGNAGASGAADVLVGLFGNDTYRVYGRGDQVIEQASQGTDTVLTSASYRLADAASVETLSAENQSATGAAAQFVLQGNAAAQLIVGNDAANTLEGGGGADTLIGRGGDDMFAFVRTAPGSGGVVTIADYAPGDRIGLGVGYYPTANGGGITADNFVAGTAARDADDRILFDQASGSLFYDPDGSGAAAAILFARVTPGIALSPGDFIYPPLQAFA